MADQVQAPTGTVYFDKLTGGMMPYADPLSIGPESYPHIWTDIQNLISWRGRLQRREGYVGEVLGDLEPDEGPVADWPILLVGFNFHETSERFLLVTTRHMWIGGLPGLHPTWYQITPTYFGTLMVAHTLTVTFGSPVVTSTAGSNWITRRIAPGNMIELGFGNWYEILTVDSETQLTLLTNYAGGSGSILHTNYRIVRTFGGDIFYPPIDEYAAAVVLNGDIYVTIKGAGIVDVGGVMTGGLTSVVLRIDRGADQAKITFTAADVSIVMSTDAMDVGTYALGDFFNPRGLEVLEDGRLVLASHVTGSTFAATNRVLFSDHLDPATWGSGTGTQGFVDLIGARGGITAMKRMGGALAVHFQDQIQLGQLSTSDTDPIAWRPTRATAGAANPRLVLSVPATENLPGGQIFFATTGELHMFDGDQSPRIPSAWADIIRDEGRAQELAFVTVYCTPVDIARTGHLSYDEWRRSVSLFAQFDDDRSFELRFDLDTGVSTKHFHKTIISATNERRLQPYGDGETPLADLEHQTFLSRVLGVRGTDTDNAFTHYLYMVAIHGLNDADIPVITFGEVPGACYAETHDLLLGAPDRESRVLRVILWYHGRAAITETLNCKLSVDSGVTWETGVGSVSIALTDSPNERRVQYYFSTSAPADRARIRLEGAGTDQFSYALSRMLIEYAPVADVRAVP